VIWNPTPTSEYSIDDQETVTTDGEAELELTVNSNAPWLAQIDFGVRVESVFDGNFVEKHFTYIVEDVIAPAAVTNPVIDPAVWTSTNSFDLVWANPPEHSGVAGAHYDVNQTTSYYVTMPDINGVQGASVDAQGVSNIRLWLEDNAGNEDVNNAVNLVAKWDNVAPEAFDLVYPSLDQWLRISNPVFDWNPTTDATAGLYRYRVVLDGVDYPVPPALDTLESPIALTESSHTLTVFAVDSALNETGVSIGIISFNVDYTDPVITHNQVLEGTVNSPLTISASFADPASGVARAELFYRKGGEMTWQTPVDMKTLPSYQIASSFVTSTGLEYYLEVEDGAGNINTKPVDGFYSVEVTISGQGLSSTKRWSTGISSGTSVANYQLLSFPGTAADRTPNDILVDDLGAYDSKKWRFFSYGSGDWIEFANINAIDPGKSYFLIVKDAGMNISTGLSRSVTTDELFEISLPLGEWVFIGNPFDFDIPLENVFDQDQVSINGNGNFYTWDGEWVAATKLEPWYGYIYKSANGGQLFIDPRKSNGGMAKLLTNEIDVLEDDEWLIDISASNGRVRDNSNRVGVLHRAEDTYDARDHFEPPMLPEGVSLRIDNRDWPDNGDIYTTDIKKVNAEGNFWDFEVIASDLKNNVNLTFAGIENIPADFDIFLIDKSIRTAQNLGGQPGYYYAIGGSNTKREFRLVAGTRDFVNANNASVALYPDAYSLSQNFPNPFNPKTTIQISIQDEAIVNLVVYNLLGKEVATIVNNEYLPAGYYNYIWSSRNHSGQRVASGIYFYSTRIKSPSGQMLLNQTKKMILVK